MPSVVVERVRVVVVVVFHTGVMAAAKKRGPKQVTDAHKRAMAVGRAESRAVSNYLEALAANRPKRGRKRQFEEEAYKMGFVHAAVGAMVRSSYHADQQAHGAGVS